MGILVSIDADLNCELTIENIQKILSYGQDLGFIYLDAIAAKRYMNSPKLSPKQSTDLVMLGFQGKRPDLTTSIYTRIHDEHTAMFFSKWGDNQLGISFSISRDILWKREFADESIHIDYNRFAEILLQLTKPFCVKKVYLTFDGFTSQMDETFGDPVVIAYAHTKDCNFTENNVFLLVCNIMDYDIKLSDIDKKPLDRQELQKNIWSRVEQGEFITFNGTHKNNPFRLTIGQHPRSAGNVGIYPLVPFAMKEVNGKQCIDTDYYVWIVLKLIEGFHMNGLNTSGF